MKICKFSLSIILLIIPTLIPGQLFTPNNNLSANHNEIPFQKYHILSNPISTLNPVLDEYGETGNNTFLGGLGTTSGYFAVPDAGGLYNLTTSGSIEAWIMPTATTSSSHEIVAKGDATAVSFLFGRVSSSSLLYLRIGSIPLTNTGGTTVPLNQWSHVAVTWTGTPGNYTVTFYVNGALSGAPEVNTDTMKSTYDSLTIGIAKPFSGNNFYGFIDEVKIWNTVRTQTQIAQNRFTGIGDYINTNNGNAITSASNYTGLVSSWTFNQNTRDDIGGKNGFLRNGAGLEYLPYSSGYPIPYNYAMSFPGFGNSYITIPYNPVFNLINSGMLEAWIYPTRQTVTHIIISLGTGGTDFFLGMRKSIGNRLVMTIGGTQFQNSDGTIIPGNKWTHIAVKWISDEGNYTVTFYVNSKQSGTPVTLPAMWNATSGTLRIGGWQGGTGNNFSGLIDEVRFWSTPLTETLIKNNMFTSCRSLLPDINLIAAWNFDGNLRNFSEENGIDGSFNTEGTNNCYISAFKNESTPGAVPDNQFEAYPTVMNCSGFPSGFINKISNIEIPDYAALSDTIKVKNLPWYLNDIQVFLAIQHQRTSDLTIKLRAPNSTEILLSAGSGGNSSNGYLTVLDDSIGNILTSSIFLSPWTNYVKPQNPMGTFWNTALNGNWILSVTDGSLDCNGTLMGWGLRFNNFLNLDSQYYPVSIPDNFYLYQNYPNPFNPVTKIKIDVPLSEFVNLTVYDILGREIKTLINKLIDEGTYIYEFDGSIYPSGIYFCRMKAKAFTSVRKMTLIK